MAGAGGTPLSGALSSIPGRNSRATAPSITLPAVVITEKFLTSEPPIKVNGRPPEK